MLKELFTNCLEGPWKTIGNDTQYKILNHRLYFQATNSNIDWKVNFDFPAIPYKNQPIRWCAHKGYLSNWKLIREVILNEMVKNKVNIIVGYSHGAALAVLAHEDYGFTIQDGLIDTYTFGGPRVIWGWQNIYNRFKQLYRVKVSGDIVTNVPFSIMGYHHIGILKEYGKNIIPWWTHHRPEEYLANLDGK
jgi:predicted lipase